MNIMSIIFDMDGTLWDSTENVCKSWLEVIERDYPQLKPFTPEEMGAQMGKLLPDIGRGLYPELDEKTCLELVERCCEYENEYLEKNGGILYPQLEETLKKLSEKCRLTIVSNCQGGYIEAFFAAHGLEKYFIDYECHGRSGLSKADNIKLIIERNGLENAAYCGDTQIDYLSSKEAGVPFIWASYGFGSPEGYDLKLESFSQLAEII